MHVRTVHPSLAPESAHGDSLKDEARTPSLSLTRHSRTYLKHALADHICLCGENIVGQRGSARPQIRPVALGTRLLMHVCQCVYVCEYVRACLWVYVRRCERAMLVVV